MKAVGLIMLIVLVAVGIPVALRRLRDRREEHEPGRSADSAIAVDDYGEVDRRVEQEVCPCGTPFSLRGEGSRMHAGRKLRIARLECPKCEQERELFFAIITPE